MVIYPMDSTIHAAFEHLGQVKDNTLGNSKKIHFVVILLYTWL